MRPICPVLVYAARIRLNRQAIKGGEQGITLAPGMAVTADVRTGQRSIASYPISPIDEARLEAGRER